MVNYTIKVYGQSDHAGTTPMKYRQDALYGASKVLQYLHDELDKLEIKVTHARCNNCENHCKLTINKFSNGSIHVSGNRCEKGAGITTNKKNLPNLVQYKYQQKMEGIKWED